MRRERFSNEKKRQPPAPARSGPVSKEKQQRPKVERLIKPSGGHVLLYGFHAVREALRVDRRRLIRLYATPAAAEKLAEEAASRSLEIKQVSAEDIAQTLPVDAVHQGILLEAKALPDLDIEDIELKTGLILVLDQVTDPHNVGAIVRTAAAFAVDALVVTERHAPQMTGILAKAASGGLEHVPIVRVGNLARALVDLRDRGIFCLGLDSDGSTDVSTLTLAKPVALVLGAEGKGLRRLTRERCDLVARLDLPGKIRSLNVSNAAAISLTRVYDAISAI